MRIIKTAKDLPTHLDILRASVRLAWLLHGGTKFASTKVLVIRVRDELYAIRAMSYPGPVVYRLLRGLLRLSFAHEIRSIRDQYDVIRHVRQPTKQIEALKEALEAEQVSRRRVLLGERATPQLANLVAAAQTGGLPYDETLAELRHGAIRFGPDGKARRMPIHPLLGSVLLAMVGGIWVSAFAYALHTVAPDLAAETWSAQIGGSIAVVLVARQMYLAGRRRIQLQKRILESARLRLTPNAAR